MDKTMLAEIQHEWRKAVVDGREPSAVALSEEAFARLMLEVVAGYVGRMDEPTEVFGLPIFLCETGGRDVEILWRPQVLSAPAR